MQVKFLPQHSATRQRRYLAQENRMGPDLPRKKQMTAQEMAEPREGEPAVYPRGTDTKTPGYTRA